MTTLSITVLSMLLDLFASPKLLYCCQALKHFEDYQANKESLPTSLSILLDLTTLPTLLDCCQVLKQLFKVTRHTRKDIMIQPCHSI